MRIKGETIAARYQELQHTFPHGYYQETSKQVRKELGEGAGVVGQLYQGLLPIFDEHSIQRWGNRSLDHHLRDSLTSTFTTTTENVRRAYHDASAALSVLYGEAFDSLSPRHQYARVVDITAQDTHAPPLGVQEFSHRKRSQQTPTDHLLDELFLTEGKEEDFQAAFKTVRTYGGNYPVRSYPDRISGRFTPIESSLPEVPNVTLLALPVTFGGGGPNHHNNALQTDVLNHLGGFLAEGQTVEDFVKEKAPKPVEEYHFRDREQTRLFRESRKLHPDEPVITPFPFNVGTDYAGMYFGARPTQYEGVSAEMHYQFPFHYHRGWRYNRPPTMGEYANEGSALVQLEIPTHLLLPNQ